MYTKLNQMTREEISFLKSHTVEISFCNRGCVVKVGCKSYAFENIEEAMAELEKYIKRPREIGKIYSPDYFDNEELTPIEEIG